MTDIEEEWRKVTESMPKPVSEWWWAEITKKYNEPGRAAHNITYLTSKFEEMGKLALVLSNFNAFVLALFFQYFHYDQKGSDVLAKNLESFEKFATEAGLLQNKDLYNEVKRLLEASATYCTEEHKTEGAYGEEDVHYFLDLDMAWLGREAEEYQKQIQNVANEYSYLDPTAYKRLRQRVLQSFLLIPNIFATKIFREKYDDKARENIQLELSTLTKG